MRFTGIRSFVAAAFAILTSSAIGGATLGAQGGRTTTFVAGVADVDTGQPLEAVVEVELGR